MQVGKDWIDFTWKPPYSAIADKPLPEDFEVVVAYLADYNIKYRIMKASRATSLYKLHPYTYLAWKAFEPYTCIVKK